MSMLKPDRLFFVFAALVAVSSSNLMAQDVSELMQEAQEALQAEDWEDAAEALGKVVKEEPKNYEAWHLLGYALHAGGDLDKALPAHKKAAEGTGRAKATALYNIACVYSLKKDKDKSFDYLEQAVKAGFVDTMHMKSDPDLKNIRDDKRFKAMVSRINNPLIGDWVAKKGKMAGKDIADDRLPAVAISDKTFTMGDGDQQFVMEYEIDKSKSPMEIDFKITKGPMGEGEKAKGIIKFDRSKVTLCYNPTGSDRPEDFKANEENKFHSFALMRKPAKKADMAQWMVGKWKCVKGVRGGSEVDQERMASVITFTEDLITIPVSADEAFEMSYSIDSSKKPIQIDMRVEAGPAPEGSEAVGIIKRDGDKFILCYDAMGAGRPEDFESTKANNFFYFEMKRDK